jgi:hypothetical protein
MSVPNLLAQPFRGMVPRMPPTTRRRAGRSPLSARFDNKVHSRVLALEAETVQQRRDLDIQFRRIAQLQAEIDQIRQSWTRVKARTGTD